MTLRAETKKDGTVELWNFTHESGPLVRCYPDGRIELFEVTMAGNEHPYGNYPTVCAALKEAEAWT